MATNAKIPWAGLPTANNVKDHDTKRCLQALEQNMRYMIQNWPQAAAALNHVMSLRQDRYDVHLVGDQQIPPANSFYGTRQMKLGYHPIDTLNYTGEDSIQITPKRGVSLVGDQSVPLPFMCYSTDAAGNKSWNPFPSEDNWAFQVFVSGTMATVNLGYWRIDGTTIDALATVNTLIYPTATLTAATATAIGFVMLPLGNPSVTYVCVRRLIADGTVVEICKVDTIRPLPTDGVYHYKPLCKCVLFTPTGDPPPPPYYIIAERYHRGDCSEASPV